MIPDSVIPEDLISGLLARTTSNELQWTMSPEYGYTVSLPDCTIGLKTNDPTAESPVIYFIVGGPGGEVMATIAIQKSDSRYQVIRSLYDTAQASSVGRVVKILEGATGSIRSQVVQLSGTGTTTSRAWGSMTITTPGPMPPPPSEVQSKAFFGRIAGEWYLDFSRGTETLRLDAQGNYYTYSPKQVPGLGVEPRLKYKFTLEQCDPAFEHVEVAKRELDEKVRQLEVLRITPMSMLGYAKHDAHVLRYVWNEWYQCWATASKQVQLRAKNGEHAKQLYIKSMGMIANPPEISVVKCLNYKPSGLDLDFDKALYPDTPFSKDT